MKTTGSHRLFYFLAFVLVGILLAGAQYLQNYRGVNPCPLCLMQRYVFWFLGFIFILGFGFGNKRPMQIILGSLSLLGSLVGIALAGRQTWLQYLPVQSGANCEVSLEYMVKVLPLNEVIKRVFEGGSGCSRVSWEFLHLSLAQWSLIFFIVFLIFSIWQFRKN